MPEFDDTIMRFTVDLSLSARVQRIKPSPTLAVTARAAQLQREGKDVIGLGAGEPDFDTPDHIKAAAIKAIQDGFTKYTAVDGTPSLKQAVICKFERDNQLQYQSNQILVSVGGKQSFFNLTQAIIEEGDEVIIPAPYWVSYPDIVLLAGGTPVIIDAPLEQRFKITPAQLEAAITPKTKLFVINSPSNPTGVAYNRRELTALAEVLLRHPHVIVATDDMYEHILWSDEPFYNLLMVCPQLYDRCLVLNGVSKSYSMTGWRIGYAAGPQKIIAAMAKVQGQSTSNPTSISQVAAETALNSDQSCVQMMCESFKQRHNYLHNALNQIRGIECIRADGTFYAFPRVQQIIDRMNMKNDVEFSEYLLNEAGVAVVPGSAFGAEGYIRLSFATSLKNLEEAVKRIKRVVEAI